MKEVVIASNNLGKIKEISEMIPNVHFISLNEIGINIEVQEDQETFEGNALKKAREINQITNKITIADDSGIGIEALNGFPGVKTARFLGEKATQQQRNNHLLNALQNQATKEERRANMVTCIAIVLSKGKECVVKGELQGYIAKEKRGENGFGFDEIFEIEDGRTLAELKQEEKNEISSRKKAILQAKQILEKE